jgi:hypothetical protein
MTSPDHRLTPTERLHEVTLAALNRTPAQPESSVTLTRNAKGDVQIEVTIRGYDPGSTADTCVAIFHGLTLAYPRGEGPSLEDQLRASVKGESYVDRIGESPSTFTKEARKKLDKWEEPIASRKAPSRPRKARVPASRVRG